MAVGSGVARRVAPRRGPVGSRWPPADTDSSDAGTADAAMVLVATASNLMTGIDIGLNQGGFRELQNLLEYVAIGLV